MAYSLDPEDPTDADDDEDDDGFTNLEEHEAGTNPTKAAIKPQIPVADNETGDNPDSPRPRKSNDNSLMIILILVTVAVVGIILYQRQMGKGHRPKEIPRPEGAKPIPKLPSADELGQLPEGEKPKLKPLSKPDAMPEVEEKAPEKSAEDTEKKTVEGEEEISAEDMGGESWMESRRG
jgi:hypothetical protein